MLKFDLWLASPSKLPSVKGDDTCCEACTGLNNDGYRTFCRACKWKKHPISLQGILKMRSVDVIPEKAKRRKAKY